MRGRENSRILWADAVCIKQADIKERGQQVCLMKRIYTEASKVIIWTGIEDEVRAQALFELLTQLATFLRQYGALDLDDSRNWESIRQSYRIGKTPWPS